MKWIYVFFMFFSSFGVNKLFALDTASSKNLPRIKLITSFENESPFDGGKIVVEHATLGKKALKLDNGFIDMTKDQDWSGYHYLMADIYSEAKVPSKLYLEICDAQTKGYWTRVNFYTVIPPGLSTFMVQIDQLFVGEKSRPGRKLLIDQITRFVFSIGNNPKAPVFIDNIRLVRETESAKVRFKGLYAFDLGMENTPLMEGFTRLTPKNRYTKELGFGLKNAQIWKTYWGTYNALQPEPLYQDWLCIEKGGLAIDVPSGVYNVFVNIDHPGGFWGEVQKYRTRSIIAEGRKVVTEAMDLKRFKERYYRFWKVEDLPTDNTFDKYQEPYFDEKEFQVTVTDGQLNIEFEGANWACPVSTIIVFPEKKIEEGQRFLKFVKDRRRFHFDNYFKRNLHPSTGVKQQPSPEDKDRGYVLFKRDYMEDVYYNDLPRPGEQLKEISGAAFAGEFEPLTFSILPLKDLGNVTVTIGDLRNPLGIVPQKNIEVGFVSYRLMRLGSSGTNYTIAPRLIFPSDSLQVKKTITRRFWFTVKVPEDAGSGMYEGRIEIHTEKGGASMSIPVKFWVHKGKLDQADIPVGPYYHTIPLPWFKNSPDIKKWDAMIARKSLKRIRDYGFTSFSSGALFHYKGFRNGQPEIDFSVGDALMQLAKETEFTMPINNYGPGNAGIHLYHKDIKRMEKAGFEDYSAFVKAIFTEYSNHSRKQKWLPVYWNLADEPHDDHLVKGIENAKEYLKAFPKGPPFFTACTSLYKAEKTSHFDLASNVHIASLNAHNEATVKMLRATGAGWAHYNGGNRWTMGVYMYKAVKEFDMKFRYVIGWSEMYGDPYYALDGIWDDTYWCNTTPMGKLVPTVILHRLREGLDDYRRMLTLARLTKSRKGSLAAQAAEDLIRDRLGKFKLGQINHRELFPSSDFTFYRKKLSAAIDLLR